MRIFFICRRVPFPPDRGDKIATFNQIRYLSRSHEVHVFCLADGKEDLANVAGLRDYATTITAVPVSLARGTLRALLAVFGAGSLSVAMLREAKLGVAVARRFADLGPDLIIVYSSNVAQFAESLTDARRIMQFADLDSCKWRDYAARTPPPLRWIYALEARRLLQHERHLARTFSCSLVCTDLEADAFRVLIPDRAIAVVGNGVDLDYFHCAGQAKLADSLIFLGVMNYFPNVDAVRWFCSELLPIIRKKRPNVNLTICGSRPTKSVRRLSQLQGVEVTGWVSDVRPFLARAEILVAPLRIARGIQNKILEGMAMGLPVVTTRAVWRAIGIPEGEGIVAADEPAEFANHVVRLLRNANDRAAMSAKARKAVERTYTWTRQLTALDRAIAEVARRTGR